jgi:hypothetical protein
VRTGFAGPHGIGQSSRRGPSVQAEALISRRSARVAW